MTFQQTSPTINDVAAAPSSNWLRTYYFTRAGVSVAWIVLALTIGRSAPQIAAVLIVAYPAWDAIANWFDAQRNGGLARNKSQAFNLAVSGLTTAAIAIALGTSMNAAFAVFGVWAGLAGILQLVTGVRRWKSYGAQWAMILSGAQSALAGTHFIMQAAGSDVPAITAIAPYAAFGAFYFLVSAIWLTVAAYRQNRALA